MTRPLRSLGLATALTGLMAALPAHAQTPHQAGASTVLSRACDGRPGQPVSAVQLAQAILSETNTSYTAFVANLQLPGTFPANTTFAEAQRTIAAAQEAALVRRLREIASDPDQSNVYLAETVANLEQALHQPREVEIAGGPGQRVVLFGDNHPALTCKPAPPPPSLRDPPSPPPRFAIRATPEELWLSGRAARKAGALSLGFQRTRSILEDGTRKTDTEFTIGGTMGVRLTRDTSRVGHVYLFANYELERARTRPRPTLNPGESESDGDTNALAIGLDGILQPFVGRHTVLDINLQGAAVFDFANDASRLRFRALLTPRTDLDLGICYLGSFSDNPTGLRGRCSVSGEVQYAHVLRRGTTELGDYDSFLAAGVQGSIEFFLPTQGGDAASTGFLASASYRFLPVIHGAPDDIERLELKLAHRFWTASNVGIDVGFTYTRGTNELSFEDENKLTFGLGLIY